MVVRSADTSTVRFRPALACLVAGGVSLVGCSGIEGRASADEPTPAPEPVVVRVGVIGEVGVDPAVLNPTRSADVLAADLLFDGLTRYDAPTAGVVPQLADSWETADGVTWTFHLDADRRFSDGSAVTAGDVVASIERVRGLAATSVAGSRLGAVTGVTAVDPTTVSIILDGANHELPALLADPSYGVTKAGAAPGTDDLVSSGGFTPVRTKESLRLIADASAAGPDEIELVTFDDVGAARASFEAGELDITSLGVADEAPSGSNLATTSAVTMVLEVNADVGPLAGADARGVLLHMLDRVAVATTATRDGSQAGSVVPGGVSSAVCMSCAVDPVAGPALAALGVAPGTLHVDVPGGATSQAVGAEIARQLTAAGLPVEVRPTDTATLQTRLAAGTQELTVFGVVGLAPTPDPYLLAVFGSGGSENLSGYGDPAFDTALAAARATADPAARAAAYRQLETSALDAGAVVPLVALGDRYAVAGRIGGVAPAAGVLFDARALTVAD